ncbi:hypothetical protein AB0H47_23820 [Streptomyces globisporus]|uniref:hypothetical protein n=1 Tax=Streptomyces globisporus TaxID=1908 RepID=UPI0034611384
MAVEQDIASHPDTARERAEYDQVLDAVVTSVSEAYYSQLVQAVSVARGRAQAAQSTVTLFAGGLMAALSVTALTDRPLVIQWLGIVSVGLWLVSALLYLRAVASPIPETLDRLKVATRQQLLNEVIDKVRQEARTIDHRQRRSNGVAAVAVALSLITFGLAVLTSPVRETADGTVLVNPSYAPVLRAACSQKAAATGGVEGKIVKNSLGTSFVEIEPARGVCQSPDSTLHVPRNQVKAVRWQDA